MPNSGVMKMPEAHWPKYAPCRVAAQKRPAGIWTAIPTQQAVSIWPTACARPVFSSNDARRQGGLLGRASLLKLREPRAASDKTALNKAAQATRPENYRGDSSSGFGNDPEHRSGDRVSHRQGVRRSAGARRRVL